MGNTTKVNKHRNRLIAVMLVISLFTGILPIHVSASAYETNMQNGIYTGLTHTYKADGYSVELSITDVWQGACNARLVIKNTGETIIDNWALAFDTGCEITNIWNAIVVDKENVSAQNASLYRYTIKNAGHNKDISVGAQVEIGFSMNIPADQTAVIIPSSFSMVQNTVVIPGDQFSVSSFIYGDMNYNYNGYFVIRNDSDTTIEDWVLGFNTDIDVIDFHTAELIERQENRYLIKNRDYNSEIKSGEQVFIGFTAKGAYGVQVDGSVTDTYMTDVRTCVTEEPTPSITMPITPIPTVTTEPTVTVTETPTEVVTPEPTVTEEITPTEVITPEPTITEEITPTDEPTPTETITSIPTEIVTPTEQPEYTMEELYSDEDGDGLPLYIEISAETDPKDPDTDRDGIPDAIELYNGTDPLVPDQGFESDKDFDHDGLTDGDEINTYNTCAYKQDTDGDGLRDRFEIEHGFDPLNPDTDGDGVPDGEEKIRQTMELTSDDLGYEYDDMCRRTGETMTLFGEDYVIPNSFGAVKKVKVDIDIAGDIEDSTYIDNIFGISVFPSTIRSRIGVPYDITVEKDFENAVITFEYDEDKLGETEEDDLCILWYDENIQRFVVLENAVVDTESNTVSCLVDHFSIYLLASLKKFIYDLKQATIGRLIRETSGENEQHIDIQVAVDVGSEYYKNNTGLVRSGFARIANAKLPEDRISLSTAFGYQVEVDNSEEDISVTDGKKYTTHSRSLGLSKAYPAMRDFLGSIQVQDQYATLMQELESMKTYFEQYSSGTKRNKVVIWVSSSFLISDYTQQRQELVNELKASGIRIYQLYTGNDIEDTMYERLKVNLKAIGGDFFKVSDEESSKAALDSIIDILSPAYPDYEVLFQFNPGQACYKMDTDKIVGVIAGIDASLNRFGPDIEIGLKEIYRNEAEGEVVVTPSDTEKVLTWRYKVESGTFTEDKNTFLTNLYKECTVEGACDYDFFRSTVYNSFYSVDNISANKKKVILVSDDVLIRNEIKKYIDDGIELYYIYVGATVDTSSKSAMDRCVADTGGKAYSVTNKNEFDDAISMILIRALSVADNKDSDGDGISDCIELTGMILPDGSTVTTDAHNPDTDNDGLDDGFEMGVDRGTLKAVIDEKNGKILYYDNAPETLFFPTYIVRSHPRFDDYDKDGYSDYDEAITYNTKGMESNVISVQLSGFEKYISVDTSSLSYAVSNGNYGGNQSWFYDENTEGINDLNSKVLRKGGCGVIASADSLIYLQKYNNRLKNKSIVENDVTKENLLFGDYDRFVRFMYNNYVTPTNVEESLQMYLSNGPLILDKDKEMASHVSDLITNGNGTYGLDPISISNGLNHYLTDKTIDEIEYTYDYSDDYYDYKKVAKQIMRTLREDFPVILHIVGMTKLYSFESTYINTTYFHNLNILKIEQDTILDKTFVYCSSWSQKRKIDLKECWNSIAYSDEVLGVGWHINVDSLIYTFKNSKHSIVYPVRTTYRGS